MKKTVGRANRPDPGLNPVGDFEKFDLSSKEIGYSKLFPVLISSGVGTRVVLHFFVATMQVFVIFD